MKHLESLRGRGRGVSSTVYPRSRVATSDETLRKFKREGGGGVSSTAYPRSRVATSDKTLRKFKRERGVSGPLHSRVANIFAFEECFRVAGYSAVTLQVWGFSVSHLNNSAISAVYLRYLQYLQLHAFLDI